MSQDEKKGDEPMFLEFIPDEFEAKPFKTLWTFFFITVGLVLTGLVSISVLSATFGAEFVGDLLKSLIFGVETKG